MRGIYSFLLFSMITIACNSSDNIPQNPKPVSTSATTGTSSTAAATAAIPVVIDDTTSIRIVTHSSDPINNLFQFDSTAAGWGGTLYRYKRGANNAAEFVDIRNMVPKNGWSEFSDFISFLHIYDIPDQSELKNYTPEANPLDITIQFEITRKGKKRMYAYANPGGRMGKHWTTDNINTFITYITSDFDFIRPN